MSDTAIKVKCPRCGAWMVGFVDLAGADEKENAGGRALAEKIIQSMHDEQCEGRVGAHGSPAVPK